MATLRKIGGRYDDRLRIGVDVDNVLAESARVAMRNISMERCLEKPLTKEDLTGYPFHKSPRLVELGISQEEVSSRLDEVWRDLHRHIPLLDPFAPAMLGLLLSKGCHIEIITTAGSRNHSMRPNVVEWLDMNKIPRSEITFTESSQAKIERPLHTILDDQEGLAKALDGAGRAGFLFDAPWNRKFAETERATGSSNVYIAGNWTEAMRITECLMKDLRR